VELAKDVATSDVSETKEGTASPSGLSGLLNTVGKQLLPVLLTGSTLIGFVALSGGAVLWSRFYAIDVPPEQVVSVVPKGESIAIGSAILIVLGLFGALATLTVYLVDRGGRASPGMSRALLLILTVEAAAAVGVTDRALETRLIALEVLAIVFGVALWSTYVGGLIELTDELPNRKDGERFQAPEETAFWQEDNECKLKRSSVAAAFVSAILFGGIAFGVSLLLSASPSLRWIVTLAAGGIWLVLVVTAHVLRFTQKRAEQKRKEKKEKEEKKLEEDEQKRAEQKTARGRLRTAWRARSNLACKSCRCTPCACSHRRSVEEGDRGDKSPTGRPPLFKLSPIGGAVMVALAVIAVAVPSVIIGKPWLIISLGTLFVIGAGLWRIAGLSGKRFLGLGLAVFISVPLFGALMLMTRNLFEPQVQAMALIRKTDGPDEAIKGIFVAETDKRVYFANVATEGCDGGVTPGSGRLLWVPTKEVVAMSIGPLQDVGDAGKSALEMAYALTPSVETPAAGAVSLTTSEQRTKEIEKAEEARRAREAEAHAPGLDQRLQDPGPAVRPNFGAGLRLFPEIASPGEVVELRLNAPNSATNGFGRRPQGRVLRLNGAPISPLREEAANADRAEYVKTKGGVVLNLDKRGEYGLSTREQPYALGDRSEYSGSRYVKLEDPADVVVSPGSFPSADRYLKVEGGRGHNRLAEGQEVKVEGGNPEPLKRVLLRQAWSKDLIRFKVPDNASSGVVTVECQQLAASPLLRVARAPVARITARIQQNSLAVSLDSSRTTDPDGEKLLRRWTVAGLRHGHRKRISTRLLPRFRPYVVKLTVTDKAGNSDSATLRLMRLPTAQFKFDSREPQPLERVTKAAKALESSVRARPPTAIELDGNTDHSGSFAYNMQLSIERDERVGEVLLREAKEPPPGEKGIPVREVGFGETCPIDPRPGRRARNRHVDVFVLEAGVIVKPARGCLQGRFKDLVWHPRQVTAQGSSSPTPPTRSQRTPTPE